MKKSAYFRRERDELDATVSDLENLIDAQQCVVWELINLQAEPGSEIDRLRNAMVGIANAMASRVRAEHARPDRGRRADAA
ncbi:hypothetical protein MAA5396_04757 [Marinovum algicola]|uniref:Uncharacterized protein n=1 Tax=Marinovum algicola TaxID=42444 RepID=A0A975WEN9_9RHOB|nr:hypothetical protein [Marinovum algicola]SEK08282.1 hypothetical protein SAMN04487940_12630 [Marinovum algicola]SLN76559.1 hypothetical protein MAA5396_04757 [Marinovum algicola]